MLVSAPDKIFSVPIVPLTEENETAMEDPVFMDFLHGLGLSPPANEQVLCASLFHLSDAPLGLELSPIGGFFLYSFRERSLFV